MAKKLNLTKEMMPMDFAAELKKLLDAEENPPFDPIFELAKAQAGMLEALNKTEAGISLQVEEIYDIVKETDENAKEVKSAAKRESQLLGGLVALNDLLDGMLRHIQAGGAEHAAPIEAKRQDTLNSFGLERHGSPGGHLDPRIHTVASAEYSDAPVESIIDILECGYVYRGSVIRKATVIISKGRENA